MAYPPERIQLFNTAIDNVSMRSAVSILIKSKNTKVAYFVNANSINLFTQHPSLRSIINCADRVFADGAGIRLAARFKGITLKDNVNGSDLLPVLCEAASIHNKKIFLLGAQRGVAQRTADNLINTYQGLNIVGTHHGYFNLSEAQQVIKKINASGCNILLVGMGSPIQEQWVEMYRHELNVDVIVAVGGLFDFYSGRISRAPLWLRQLGLEWVWRLIQEPNIKFKRYVIGNPLFIFRMLVAYKGGNL